MSSPYHDIVSWAESAYPSANYDAFTEWTKDVIADFNQSGHYLPEQILAELQEHWLAEYGVLDKNSLEQDEEIADETEQDEQDAIEKQVSDLPSKQEHKQDVQLRRHIREQKRRTTLAKRKAKGRRSRKRRKSSRR